MFPRDCWFNLQLTLISYRIFVCLFQEAPETVRFVSTGKPKNYAAQKTVTPFHSKSWFCMATPMIIGRISIKPYVRSGLNSHLFPVLGEGRFPKGGKPHDRFFGNRSQIQQFRDFCCICMTHFIAMKKSQPILYSTWICLFDAWKKNHILSQMGGFWLVMYHPEKG